jgi:hypothetical protein
VSNALFLSLSPKPRHSVVSKSDQLILYPFRSAVLIELHGFNKIVAVPYDATAFANRGPFYNINCVLRWKTPALDTKVCSYMHRVLSLPCSQRHFSCVVQMRAWARTVETHVRAEERRLSGKDLTGSRGVRSPSPPSLISYLLIIYRAVLELRPRRRTRARRVRGPLRPTCGAQGKVRPRDGVPEVVPDRASDIGWGCLSLRFSLWWWALW